jgi:DNA-directed RNA polymerase beta subunit
MRLHLTAVAVYTLLVLCVFVCIIYIFLHRDDVFCRACEGKGRPEKVAMPYVFRYLANELAGMGIKITLTLDQH